MRDGRKGESKVGRKRGNEERRTTKEGKGNKSGKYTFKVPNSQCP